jgi:hypothetical protein
VLTGLGGLPLDAGEHELRIVERLGDTYQSRIGERSSSNFGVESSISRARQTTILNRDLLLKASHLT